MQKVWYFGIKIAFNYLKNIKPSHTLKSINLFLQILYDNIHYKYIKL